jgi:hypothetical protein
LRLSAITAARANQIQPRFSCRTIVTSAESAIRGFMSELPIDHANWELTSSNDAEEEDEHGESELLGSLDECTQEDIS